MADKTFTQMTEEEFKLFLINVRYWIGKKKDSSFDVSIECLPKEKINLERLKALLHVVNENNNIHSLEFSISDAMEIEGAAEGIGVEGAKVLAECLKTNTTIHSLSLRNHGIGTEGANALADALQLNQTLQTINLSDCSIKDISQIAAVLKTNKGIQEINLSSNGLDLNSVVQMAEVLKFNKTLTSLLFNYNTVDDKSARIFAEGLKQNDRLKRLSIHQDIYDVGYPITRSGAESFSEVLQKYNLSLCELDYELQEDWEVLFRREDGDPCEHYLERNKAFADLNDSINSFRNKLREYSIPLKKNISRKELEKYLDMANCRVDDKKTILAGYSFPIAFDKLSNTVQQKILASRENWKTPGAIYDTMPAADLYYYNSLNIKLLDDINPKTTVETPVLKEKIDKKIKEAYEALDLAYYGRDAECLELDLDERISKLEAVLKTTKNNAHQKDAKESLLPLYYSLMARTKDADEEKMYALSILACGAEEDGVFNKATIAAQYQIKDIEEELKKRKEELNLVDKSQEEKQSEKTNNQKIYSNPNQSSFTKFHPQSEGTSTNATPGASTSPTPAPGVSLDPAEGKKNDM